MPKKQILKISADGLSVTGVYTDLVEGLGEASIERASSVEFCQDIGKWVVEMRIGPLAGACLSETFNRRKDALDAEVRLLTDQHLLGYL